MIHRWMVMQAEATGDDVELGFIMVHAQDHLMTTLLLKRYHWNTDRRISCVKQKEESFYEKN